jgi:hypothetical protein
MESRSGLGSVESSSGLGSVESSWDTALPEHSNACDARPPILVEQSVPERAMLFHHVQMFVKTIQPIHRYKALESRLNQLAHRGHFDPFSGRFFGEQALFSDFAQWICGHVTFLILCIISANIRECYLWTAH